MHPNLASLMFWRGVLVFAWLAARLAGAAEQPLTTLEYHILGVQLQVTPAAVSVPKGIPGSVMVQIADATGNTNNVPAELAQGAYVQAIFRGPSFPARRLVAKPNEALMLPALSLVGDYQLDAVQLVDAASGAVRLEGSPRSVPVKVFDDVLISRVTSRPLSLDEIQAKGIIIDQQNFRAVEFEVGFVLDGQQIPVKFPVVAPVWASKAEIIPVAEMQARMAEAQRVNDLLASDSMQGGTVPKELQAPGLNIQIKGVNFQAGEDEPPALALGIPPIPALMVIPGNIGYLNQFFSVQIFTENGAPLGSGLSVFNVQAKLNLPPGPDQILSTNYSQPGDDPLRFARVGSKAEIHDQLSLLGPPPVSATRFQPGEGGSAEFLVEGLQEGLHVMNLDLTASLDGLAAGTMKIAGQAAGSVLVRNPKFSLAFTHPKGVSFGEPYTASVTLLNTGDTEANLVSVTLRQASLSGGQLESPETVQLGNLAPGQSATATYRVRAQRTGRIRFSNLTTSEASVQGRFNLTMALDERGVELSPDAVAMPDYVDILPQALVDAVRRVLGQALSVSTAGRLPAGVKPIARWVITTRVLELAEAGQRVRYGEPLGRVLPELLLDWQGGRSFEDGFDQIIRETDAGREWREALQAATESADSLDAAARVVERADDLAGRGEAWVISGSSVPMLEPGLDESGLAVSLDRSALIQSAAYRGTNGHWLAARATNGVVRWIAAADSPRAELALLTLTTNGNGQLLRWSVADVRAGNCFRYDLAAGGVALVRDSHCNGTVDASVNGTNTVVQERAPELLTVFQETTVQFLRPWGSCYQNEAKNYGNLVAVLFSKPMTQTNLDIPQAYTLDSGTPGVSVQIQQGNRVALVAMNEPLSALIPRTLTVDGVTDVRGHRVEPKPHPIQTAFAEGVTARGRVLRMDGSPAVGVPVTLTMLDLFQTPQSCEPVITRTAQKFTDTQGYFDLDFIFGGVPFTVAAVDTGGLPFNLVTNLLASFDADKFRSEMFVAQLAQSNVLASLGGRTATEAVALAEGLDRAVWQDQIDLGGGRAGHTLTIGLRFRGRGTVTGTVLEADGVTPAGGAAVNLFPDEASRELGRGLFSDANGRFQFNGVPLGRFSVNVQTSRGHFRTLADTLDQPGQTKDLHVILTAPTPQEIVRTRVQGRVTESDHATPAPGAQVFLGIGAAVLAAPTADTSGYWVADNLPVGSYRITAISSDGQRAGQGSIDAIVGDTAFADISLSGVGRIVGRVETSAGLPVPDAVVAGGRSLVRTDTNGLFILESVALGSRSISVGWEADKAPGGFPRLGGNSVTVLPGLDNFVVVRLNPAGQIIGQVRDANGNVVPKVKVAIPVPGGFAWVEADDEGRYKFINMGLDTQYTVSAPSPPIVEDEANALLAAAGVSVGTDPSDDLVLATVAAVLSHNKQLDPASQPPTPLPGGGFGWTHTALHFDGETAIANISLLPSGKVSGTVMNDQGVPIGARVRLTGIVRSSTGEPVFNVVGNSDSDAATGQFKLVGLLAGDWGVQVASPFYPVVLSQSGRTTKEALDVTNLVFKFPPINEVNGRLTGVVKYPDGQPAGAGVQVQISFGSDYIIQTDTNGFFDTQIKLPATTYHVEARDPATGLKGQANAEVKASITNFVTIDLLGQGSIVVTVIDAFGVPVVGADVEAIKLGYPGGEFRGPTGKDGRFVLDNLFVGDYAIHAAFNAGVSKLEARGTLAASHLSTNSLILQLGATAGLRGVFLTLDTRQPIAFGRVNVSNVASVPTDAQGRFEVTGLSLGTYRIVALDSVTGHAGLNSVTLNYAGQMADVTVVELAQGSVSGLVFKTGQAKPVAGAVVTLAELNGLNPSRMVTTGPDGAFNFPGVLPGDFDLHAALDNGSAAAKGSFPDAPTNLVVNLTLPADPVLGSITVQVVEPDGVTAATNAQVSINGALAGDVDFTARVVAAQLLMGVYAIRAVSTAPGRTSSIGVVAATLTEAATNVSVTVRLSGVGAVTGQVLLSDAVTPAAAAEVTYAAQSGTILLSRTIFTDASGRFHFENLPLAAYLVTSRSVALAARDTGTLTSDGQTNHVTLVLGASGTVLGRIVRADGSTAVTDNEVTISFLAPSGLDGLLMATTDTNGGFRFDNVPVGGALLRANLIAYNGLLTRNIFLRTNQQVLDLGALRMDEDWPEVVSVTPTNMSMGVSITSIVDIALSEPIQAGSFDAGGVYLAGPSNTVAGTVQLLNDTNRQPTLIRVTPKAPLQSLTTYQLIVVDGDRKNAVGSVVGRGPLDLVDRPLLTPFVSTFTTRDDDPPQLVSIFPTNGQLQVDPRAVLRLSFNEPIRQTNLIFTLTGPAGPVLGQTDVGFNGLVLVFTPSNALPVNSTFTLSVSGIADLAGNALPNQPLTSTFSTLDTIGPTIQTLRLANGAAPIAGAPVRLEAILAAPEPGATVRFTKDLNPVGMATNTPYLLSVTLPTNGFVIYRAIATDQYGNDGPVAELRVDVVPNAPPTLSLTPVNPPNTLIGSGQSLRLRLQATDDLTVTNVTLVATGALTATWTFTNSISTNLSIAVPRDAVPGSVIVFHAQAVDALGLPSSDTRLDYTVFDHTAPSLSILSPANGARINPLQPLVIQLQSSDNSSGIIVTSVLSGAVSTTQTLAVALTPGTVKVTSLTMPLSSAPLNGGTFTLSISASDGATNATSVTRNLLLQDVQPPRLLSLTPTNGATGLSLWMNGLRFNFDEAIDFTTVTTNSLRLSNAAGLVPLVFQSANNGRDVVAIPSAPPLQPGVLYTGILGAFLADASSNRWVFPDGSSPTNNGLNFAFTTAKVVAVEPAQGAPIQGGTSFVAQVTFEPGLGASVFRFRLGNRPAIIATPANSTNVTATLAVELDPDPTSLTLKIEADITSSFTQPCTLANLALTFAGNAVTNQPPVVNLVRLAPAQGPLASGMNFSLRLSATDDFGVTNLVLTGAGAIVTNAVFAYGNARDFALHVPSNTASANQLFQAWAVDTQGATSLVAVLNLPILPAITHIATNEVVYSRFGQPDGSIYVSASDGSNERQITVGEYPRLSPDGRNLAFKRDGQLSAGSTYFYLANLYIRDLETGDERLIQTVSSFKVLYDWRADGSKLVFDDGGSLYEWNLAGGNAQLLLTRNGNDEAPAINPIDGRLAFANKTFNQGLWVSDPLPALINMVKIPGAVPGQDYPVWSRDGEWIAYLDSNDNGNLWKVRPDGSGLTRLTSLAGTNRVRGAGVWNADGSQMLVPANAQGSNGLFAVNTDGSGLSLVRPNLGGADYDFVGSFNTGPQPGVPGRLASFDPAQGSPGVSLWPATNRVLFSRSVAPSTVPGHVVFTNNAGLPVPYTVESDGTRVWIRPSLPLAPGVTYTNLVLPGLTDRLGRPILTSSGQPIPSGGVASAFTTAAITAVDPAPGTAFDAGGFVTATVRFQVGLGADFFRFQVDNGSSKDVVLDAGATSASATLPLPIQGTQATLRITANRQGQPPYALPPVTLMLHPLAGPPIQFQVAPAVSLLAGAVTNLAVVVNCSDGPLAFVDIDPASATPAFAALHNVSYSLTGTNGAADGVLNLQPSAADAGVYTITLLARSQAGHSATTNVAVAVTANPALGLSRWKDPVNGNWADASKWSAGLPNGTNEAVIDVAGDYTVTLDTAPTIGRLSLGADHGTQMLVTAGYTLTVDNLILVRSNAVLRLNSGSLQGAGELRVRGRFIWDAGAMQGSGSTLVLPGGSLLLTNAGYHYQYQMIENAGVTELSGGGRWYLMGSSICRNLASGAFHWSGAGDLFTGGGSPLFENQGLMQKSAAVTNSMSVNFDNRGEVQVQAGWLSFTGGGTNNQTMTVANGATLEVDNTFLFATNSTLMSTGSVLLGSGGTKTVNAPLQMSQPLVMVGTTVEFNSDQVLSDLWITNATVQGVGTLTVTNQLVWYGGTMQGTGKTVIGPAGTLVIAGNGNCSQYRLIENAGVTEFGGGGRWYLASSTFRNLASGVFLWDGLGDFHYAGGSPTFENWGLLQKSAAVTNTMGVFLDNRNTVQIQAGRLVLTGSGANQGAIPVAAAAAVDLASSFTYTEASSLGGLGSLTFSGGTHDLKGAFNPQGPLVFTGGTISLGSSLTLPGLLPITGGTVILNADSSVGTLNLSGGTLDGSGNLTVATLNWTAGTMLGTGRTILAEGGSASLASSGTCYLYRPFENRGSLVLASAERVYLAGSLWNTRVGTVLQSGPADLWYAGGAAVITNTGLWNKTFSGTNTISVSFVNQAPFALTNGVLVLTGGGINDSTIDVQAGTELRLSASITYTTNSILGGAGTIRFTAGTHDLKGQFAPQGPVWFDGGSVTIYQPILPDGLLSITNNASVIFNASQRFAIVQQSGTLDGTGDVTVTNAYIWLGGSLQGAGRLLVLPAATIWITNTDGQNRYLYRPTELGGGWIQSSDSRIYLNGTLWLQAGSLVQWSGSGAWWYAGGASAVTNDGAIMRSGGGTNEIYVPFTHRGRLTVADGGLKLSMGGAYSGPVTVSAGASLIFSGGTHSFTNGVSFAGSGAVRFQSAIRLDTPLDLGSLTAYFEGNATAGGSGGIISGAGGKISVSHGLSLPGDLTINGNLETTSADVTLTVNGTLTLAAGSILNNPGAIRVKALVDHGTVITGNAPVIIPGALFSVHLDSLRLGASLTPGQAPQRTGDSSASQVILRWTSASSWPAQIEWSADCVHWQKVNATVLRTGPDSYEAGFPRTSTDRAFYRLRLPATGP